MSRVVLSYLVVINLSRKSIQRCRYGYRAFTSLSLGDPSHPIVQSLDRWGDRIDHIIDNIGQFLKGIYPLEAHFFSELSSVFLVLRCFS